jgi:hypothetical protein
MVSDRMSVVLALLDGDRGRKLNAGLSSAAADAAALALGVDGISAGVGTGPEGVVLAWGQETIGVELEGVQFTLGQGPGIDAVAAGVPVLVPDLGGAAGRWPAFVSACGGLGVRAVFAFPLRIGAISVGGLLAHRRSPGPLADGELADALALADAITLFLLHRQSAGAGAIADDDPTSPRPGWARPATYRAEVHQATGIISVQLEVGLAEALVRLRAYAYGNDRLITEVAANVVAGRLRFDNRNRYRP